MEDIKAKMSHHGSSDSDICMTPFPCPLVIPKAADSNKKRMKEAVKRTPASGWDHINRQNDAVVGGLCPSAA